MVDHHEDRAETTEDAGEATGPVADQQAGGTQENSASSENDIVDETSADEVLADEAEDESEIAADYLEELLDIADLDGDIDIEVHQNRTYLSVVTDENEEDLELLVGRRGEVLDALQELVRLSVLAATGERTRLILDVAGYRDRRGKELRDMAVNAIESVKDTGEPCHLKPLSPYERKLVHDVVAEHGFHSESEGEGSRRHIVITSPQSNGVSE
ncbi:Jag family protein [Kocuria sp. HSID16901]|uniref:Jag family protein n=1 Tax=Kocuria sp. HSID16901 TaxID=2419505 RepID=UPI0009E25568|nr:R3H domain-containing nucleic acid-binding protein [Kocuria sp. HSID16901]MCT1367741.1 KH domain-containing protein [Rothia sp. p3-SID1597]RUQ20292.1 KH domain-containing protein [Kocuria sp. HSID16901]